MFSAMLGGFADQQLARDLARSTVEGRENTVEAFAAYVNAFPNSGRRRWSTNGLVTCAHCVTIRGGPWSYRLDTFNISYGLASPEVFLGTPPTRSIDERGFLR
ncbi:hypothetical protein ACFWBV_35435 [Streptomyces sp. NPDC060030]|uniref:hypothetical protein n=1 Tax=Streptomyces sp. NPDC060030 TaxID=3347042 RepID=UPI003681EF18